MTASASASSPIASGPSRGQPKSQWASSDVRSGCPEDRKASAKTRTLSSVCCARTRRPGAKALCADNCQTGVQQKGSGCAARSTLCSQMRHSSGRQGDSSSVIYSSSMPFSAAPGKAGLGLPEQYCRPVVLAAGYGKTADP